MIYVTEHMWIPKNSCMIKSDVRRCNFYVNISSSFSNDEGLVNTSEWLDSFWWSRYKKNLKAGLFCFQ